MKRKLIITTNYVLFIFTISLLETNWIEIDMVGFEGC